MFFGLFYKLPNINHILWLSFVVILLVASSYCLQLCIFALIVVYLWQTHPKKKNHYNIHPNPILSSPIDLSFWKKKKFVSQLTAVNRIF